MTDKQKIRAAIWARDKFGPKKKTTQFCSCHQVEDVRDRECLPQGSFTNLRVKDQSQITLTLQRKDEVFPSQQENRL